MGECDASIASPVSAQGAPSVRVTAASLTIPITNSPAARGPHHREYQQQELSRLHTAVEGARHTGSARRTPLTGHPFEGRAGERGGGWAGWSGESWGIALRPDREGLPEATR